MTSRGRFQTRMVVTRLNPSPAPAKTNIRSSGLLGTLHTLRQQTAKNDGLPSQALADFVAPREAHISDWIGAFALTAGLGAEELVARHERENDPYAAIMVKALAEWLHQRARREWGYGNDEALEVADLIRE